MNVNILKITKEMWLEIDNGNKHYDIRKLNKDYIQKGNKILFIDVETSMIYGYCKCIDKAYATPFEIVNSNMHDLTREYVKRAYWEEPYLIVIGLE